MGGFYQFNFIADHVTETDAATVNIDTYAGVIHSWIMAQNTTINFLYEGLFTTLVITCDGTPRTITWGTGAHGAAASYVLTASKKHTLKFEYDGISEHVLISTQVLS